MKEKQANSRIAFRNFCVLFIFCVSPAFFMYFRNAEKQLILLQVVIAMVTGCGYLLYHYNDIMSKYEKKIIILNIIVFLLIGVLGFYGPRLLG